MSNIQWIQNQYKNIASTPDEASYFTEKEMKQAQSFHGTLPNYEVTPLHNLSNLANSIGVKQIYAKDESKRFGLNAFKGLGASYAMATYFAKRLSLNQATIDFPSLIERVKALPQSTIATVTAGNHGKGVAWAGQLFAQDVKVYLPKGSSQSRLEAIQAFDADASISDLNYDDTVLEIAKRAEEKDWVLMQDTAWEGYEQIPLAIMQGYTTIVAELSQQLEGSFKKVTHVFLQAGVGSFAASIVAAIFHATSGVIPKIIIVEPTEAACISQSAEDPTGKPQRVHGDLATMMAGLACGEPNPFGWRILKSMSDYIFACDDAVSAKGMRLYGNPLGEDAKIISGESGAVSLGLLHELMSNPELNAVKKKLDLDDTSSVLLINTEGDTNPENYRKIV